MVALVRRTELGLGDAVPASARQAIREELAKDPRATRKVYAALVEKVWSLLIERRFDPEIRDWHVLLEGVKARIRSMDEAASERVSALADLVHVSITLSEISPAHEVANRPRARAILEQLSLTDGFTKRQALLEKLDIKGSHLSNVLTQLAAHGLIDRRDRGKEAEFRLTRSGKLAIGVEQEAHAVKVTMGSEPDFDSVFAVSNFDQEQPGSGWENMFNPTAMQVNLVGGVMMTTNFDSLRQRTDPYSHAVATDRLVDVWRAPKKKKLESLSWTR